MRDRAQLGPTPTWLPVTLIGGTILLLVAAELRDRVGAVDGPVAYCGLCHVDWTPVASLLIIAALVGVISLVARSGVAPTRFRGGDNE
jgi:hypothetical protein